MLQTSGKEWTWEEVEAIMHSAIDKATEADSLSGIAGVLDNDETFSDSELGVTVIRSESLRKMREKIARAAKAMEGKQAAHNATVKK